MAKVPETKQVYAGNLTRRIAGFARTEIGALRLNEDEFKNAQ